MLNKAAGVMWPNGRFKFILVLKMSTMTLGDPARQQFAKLNRPHEPAPWDFPFRGTGGLLDVSPYTAVNFVSQHCYETAAAHHYRPVDIALGVSEWSGGPARAASRSDPPALRTNRAAP